MNLYDHYLTSFIPKHCPRIYNLLNHHHLFKSHCKALLLSRTRVRGYLTYYSPQNSQYLATHQIIGAGRLPRAWLRSWYPGRLGRQPQEGIQYVLEGRGARRRPGDAQVQRPLRVLPVCNPLLMIDFICGFDDQLLNLLHEWYARIVIFGDFKECT